MTEYFIDPIRGSDLVRIVETGPADPNFEIDDAIPQPDPVVELPDVDGGHYGEVYHELRKARIHVEKLHNWAKSMREPLLHSIGSKLADEALGAVDGVLDMMEGS